MADPKCGSCGAPIRWAKNGATGARLPLVAKPIANVRRELLKPGMAVLGPKGETARLLTLSDIAATDERREGIDRAIAEERVYITHFADCPASQRHSGVGRRQSSLPI